MAAIIHNAALRHDQAFIATATSYFVVTLDHHRPSLQAATLVGEVHDSRARIQATGDDERRRVERDIHDGAQRRLVELRINLKLAVEQTESVDPDRAKVLCELGAVGHGHRRSPVLGTRHLFQRPRRSRPRPALRWAARQTALPTTVRAGGVRRYLRDIESAAYFCLEALQKADKHVHGATAAVVELSAYGVLRMEVRDDGAGLDAATATAGAGFGNMRDRLAAVVAHSCPGRGTGLVVMIPPSKWKAETQCANAR